MVGAVHPLLDAAPPCLGPANTGDGPLRQVDIHVNSHFKTEWLND